MPEVIYVGSDGVARRSMPPLASLCRVATLPAGGFDAVRGRLVENRGAADQASLVRCGCAP
ncbi:MAG TPA: hypothetical protein VNP97_12895, partial [Microbacterium sp.]|nr:hypothetical protein [Microbacterium sp.]